MIGLTKLLLKAAATKQLVARRQAAQALRRACQQGSEVMQETTKVREVPWQPNPAEVAEGERVSIAGTGCIEQPYQVCSQESTECVSLTSTEKRSFYATTGASESKDTEDKSQDHDQVEDVTEVIRPA